jgi:flagellar biogenesis protein FliO/LysM repeat protein
MRHLLTRVGILIIITGLGFTLPCAAPAEQPDGGGPETAAAAQFVPGAGLEGDSIGPSRYSLSAPSRAKAQTQEVRQTTSEQPVPVVSKPASKAADKPPAAAAATYKVKPGDTLEVIARAHGVSVRAIMQANSLDSPSRIIAGKTLQIPGAARRPQPKEASGEKPSKTSPAPAKSIESASAPSAEIVQSPPQTSAAAPPEEWSGLGLGCKDSKEETSDEDEAAASSGELTGKIGAGGPNLLNTSGMLLSLMLKLGLVLAIAYLGALGLRRLSGGKSVSSSREGPLKVLETITLGPNRWLHIIGVGGQAFLVASTPQQTTLLAEIQDGKVIKEFTERNSQGAGFSAQLGRLLGRDKENPLAMKFAGANEFLTRKVSDLRGLSGADSPFGGWRR